MLLHNTLWTAKQTHRLVYLNSPSVCPLQGNLAVNSVPSPHIQNQVISYKPHTCVNAIARRENIPTAGHSFFQSALRRLDALVIRPGIQKPAIHISNQTNPIAYKALHLRNIHVSLGIQGVRGTLGELLKNRHDVTTGVFDHIEILRTISAPKSGKIRRNEFSKPLWWYECPCVEAIVGAKGKPVEAAVRCQSLGPVKCNTRFSASALTSSGSSTNPTCHHHWVCWMSHPPAASESIGYPTARAPRQSFEGSPPLDSDSGAGKLLRARTDPRFLYTDPPCLSGASLAQTHPSSPTSVIGSEMDEPFRTLPS